MLLQNGLYLRGRLWLILVVGIGVLFSTPVSCDAAGLMFRFRDRATIGFGVVLSRKPSLRFEPEIGFSFNDSKYDEEFRLGDATTNGTSFDAGLGVLYILPHQGPFSVYLGPRGGYSRLDASSESTTFGTFTRDTGTNGWFASGVLGAEVRVTSWASLGVEGAIVYQNSSGTLKETSGTTTIEGDLSTSGTSTAFSIVLRWFPWDSE